MSARKAKRPARKAAPSPARKAPKPVIPATVVDDMVAAISLVDVVKHSLESQEVASPEQVVLKLALKKLWVVHDLLIEVAPDHDDDDEGGDE